MIYIMFLLPPLLTFWLLHLCHMTQPSPSQPPLASLQLLAGEWAENVERQRLTESHGPSDLADVTLIPVTLSYIFFYPQIPRDIPVSFQKTKPNHPSFLCHFLTTKASSFCCVASQWVGREGQKVVQYEPWEGEIGIDFHCKTPSSPNPCPTQRSLSYNRSSYRF